MQDYVYFRFMYTLDPTDGLWVWLSVNRNIRRLMICLHFHDLTESCSGSV